MSAQRLAVLVGVLGLAALCSPRVARQAHAQSLGEMNTVTQGMDTLNGGSTGGGLNTNYYMGKAQGAVDNANNSASFNYQNMGVPGGQMPGDPGQLGQVPGGAPGAPSQAGQNAMTAKALEKKITVITGKRVYDVISGELIDDVVRKQVPESQKTKFFDDGTHGDLIPGDDIYTRIDGEEREAISASNQKVKERLIQSLKVAEAYGPVEFYGFSLLSTDRQDPLPRSEAWRIVKDPNGGPGYVMAEVPVEEPIRVPKYREKVKEKDRTVKDDWSYRFLQEYRVKKDDLASEFYPVYIPQPPYPPTVAPPPGWAPFSDPGALARAEAAQNPDRGNRRGGGMGGGMPGGMPGGGGMR